jgi:hypothetical protein
VVRHVVHVTSEGFISGGYGLIIDRHVPQFWRQFYSE